jgi:hypothetical protein
MLEAGRGPDFDDSSGKSMISELEDQKKHSRHHSNKNLEFYFWEGPSPGPLVAWTINGKERIALGFWMHLKEATDLTPYVIVERGSLFDALKRHYESMIDEARTVHAYVLPKK